MQITVNRAASVRIIYDLTPQEWAAQASLAGKSGLYSWAQHGLTVSVDPALRRITFNAANEAWGTWQVGASDIPYHMVIDPAAAVMNGANVASVPVTGVAAGSATPAGGTVGRTEPHAFDMGGNALVLPAPVDLRGKRVFIPYIRSGSGGQPYMLGQNGADGVDLRLLTNAFANGAAGIQYRLGGNLLTRVPRGDTASWYLYEFGVTPEGQFRAWLDGLEFPPAPIDVSAPIMVDLIGRDYLASSTGAMTGRLGRVVILDAPTDQQANLEREALLLAYKPAAAPITQTLGRDTDTSKWVALDIQMEAVAQKEADAAAGFNRSDEADPQFYHGLAYLNHAEFPVVMSQPQPPMADVRKYFPGADILRTGFNHWHLTASGDFIEPSAQAMIVEWIAAGGKWQPVHMWLGQENAPEPIRDQGTTSILEFGRTTVPATIKEGWRRFRLWYDKQTPQIRAGVIALEIMNEPDFYKKCAALDTANPDPEYWYQKFADDQIEIARQLAEWWDGPIMPAYWGYNGQHEPLTRQNALGLTPKAKIVSALGNRLIWSLHTYPGWASGTTLETFWAGRQPGLDFAAPYRVVVTELNAGDYRPENDETDVYLMTQILTQYLERGVGIGWFSGVNYAAAMVSYWSAPVSLRNPDRNGAFLNAATFNKTVAYDYSDTTTRVMRSLADPRGGSDIGIHIKVGTTGGDTFTAGSAASFFYGGAGNDVMTISPTHSTWIYGQPGNDTIHAQAGPFAIVILGAGDDTVNLGADRLIVYGAAGADRFVLRNSGTAFIDNFEVGTDRLDARPVFASQAAFSAAVSTSADDLVITLPGGGTVTLLRRAGANPASLTVPW